MVKMPRQSKQSARRRQAQDHQTPEESDEPPGPSTSNSATNSQGENQKNLWKLKVELVNANYPFLFTFWTDL